MKRLKYELINSPSELRLKIYGSSQEDLFRNALEVMFESAEPLTAEEKKRVTRSLNITARDLESLLVDFLSESLTLSDIYNEAYDALKVDMMDAQHIRAELQGYKVRGFEIEIKAVTYHDVRIVTQAGQLSTELVLDI